MTAVLVKSNVQHTLNLLNLLQVTPIMVELNDFKIVVVAVY